MTNLGYVKVHRKVLDNPLICKDSDYFAIWHYLILKATHESYTEFFKGEKILLQPGQLITGRKKISEKFNINESKVQRVLKDFESEHQIEQVTSNKNRLISIVNWNKYQLNNKDFKQPVNNQRTTSEQPVNTNKNVKKLYLYYLNKYNGEKRKTFYDKMKFLRTIKQDEKYNELNAEEEKELRALILGDKLN